MIHKYNTKENLTLNELRQKAAEFSDKTFGYNNKDRLLPVAYKFIEEANELLEAIKNNKSFDEINDEFADSFLLLIDLYRIYNGNMVDMQNLIDLSSRKLDICETRKWGKPDNYGVCHHI